MSTPPRIVTYTLAIATFYEKFFLWISDRIHKVKKIVLDKEKEMTPATTK